MSHCKNHHGGTSTDAAERTQFAAFGDAITADHIALDDKQAGYRGQKYAIALKDLATG